MQEAYHKALECAREANSPADLVVLGGHWKNGGWMGWFTACVKVLWSCLLERGGRCLLEGSC